jgi:hypothetical protein
MSTSEKTFTQVKDILRKLERSIDEAREKRLHHDDDAEVPAATPSPRPSEPGRAQPMGASTRQDPTRTSSAGWMSR